MVSCFSEQMYFLHLEISWSNASHHLKTSKSTREHGKTFIFQRFLTFFNVFFYFSKKNRSRSDAPLSANAHQRHIAALAEFVFWLRSSSFFAFFKNMRIPRGGARFRPFPPSTIILMFSMCS